MALHPDESMFASFNDACGLQVYDIRKQSVSSQFKKTRNLESIAFSTRGDYLYLGNQGGIIQQVDFERVRYGDVSSPINPRIPSKKELVENERKINHGLDRTVANLEYLNRDLKVDLNDVRNYILGSKHMRRLLVKWRSN